MRRVREEGVLLAHAQTLEALGQSGPSLHWIIVVHRPQVNGGFGNHLQETDVESAQVLLHYPRRQVLHLVLQQVDSSANTQQTSLRLTSNEVCYKFFDYSILQDRVNLSA